MVWFRLKLIWAIEMLHEFYLRYYEYHFKFHSVPITIFFGNAGDEVKCLKQNYCR